MVQLLFMSKKHPIIAVVRSSGVGTTQVRAAFNHVLLREELRFAEVKGESFHRYDRAGMKKALKEAEHNHPDFSHFGPEANLFEELETLFRTYGESGKGRRRHYLHNAEDAERFNHPGLKPGDITPWEDIPEGTDLMLYEGLHGCVVTDKVDISKHVDLRIGVVPVINLEWIQKIHRDTSQRGYSEEAVMETILRRMHDYVHYIIPQFEKTDINIQMAPVVDTSDPIIARDVPTSDECVAVIRFREPDKLNVNFPFLLQMIHNSWMSRRNSIVVPGSKVGLALELTLPQIVRRMLDNR